MTSDRTHRPRPLLRTTLGAVLRRTRLEQSRTLADVAGRARVSLPYLSELERGRKEASSEILAALCDALGVGLPELLAEVGRDLVLDRDSRVTVIRLASAGGPGPAGDPARGSSSGRGTGDVVCLLAA